MYQCLSKYLLDEEMMLSVLGDDKGLERNVFPGCFYYIWMKVKDIITIVFSREANQNLNRKAVSLPSTQTENTVQL